MHPDHFNFAFSARQIFWTLTFAAQLVLLVVLLGRDRIRRYPWFTAGITLFALRLMAEVLLAGRMAMLPMQTILLSVSDLGVIVNLLVLVEVAWQAFGKAPRNQWIANTIGVLVVGIGALIVWGPWPQRSDLVWDTVVGRLHLMQLAAIKGDLLVDLLTVEVGLLVLLFGRSFQAGWRSHTQMISIGLSVAALSWLSIVGAWEVISLRVHPKSQAEYQSVLNLGATLMNVNKGVYVAALVWWIVWLWLDEPNKDEPNKDEPESGLPAEEPTAGAPTGNVLPPAGE
jgi:hypothetical protein